MTKNNKRMLLGVTRIIFQSKHFYCYRYGTENHIHNLIQAYTEVIVDFIVCVIYCDSYDSLARILHCHWRKRRKASEPNQ